MTITKNYILFYFSRVFLQILFVVFLLTAIISFVEIVTKTYIAQIDFLTLLLLLAYKIPNMAIYLMPVVYFVSFVISIRQLSLDSEMVVLFSIGLSPLKLAKIIFVNSLLISLVMFVLAFVVMPVTMQAYKLLVQELKTNTGLKNLNKAGFVQKFDNWHIFISGEDKERNIVLFSNNFQNQSSFILAKEASYENSNGNIQLKLKNGKIFTKQKEMLDQINFSQMVINKKNRPTIFGYLEIHLFWLKILKEKKYDFLFMPIFLVLFPMLCVLPILYLGITEHRHPSKYISFLITIHIMVYFYFAFLVNETPYPLGLVLVPLFWLIGTCIIFYKMVIKKF